MIKQFGIKRLPLRQPAFYLPEYTGGGGGGGVCCWQEARTAADAMRVRIAIFMCVCGY
jgi:hypothetical protein